LEALPAHEAFSNPQAVLALLALDRRCNEYTSFHGYIFPDRLAPELYPSVVRLAQPNTIGRPVFGVVVDERVVCACSSVRENSKAAEAWVWTLPQFQRRGYARQVTSAWAHDLRQQHKIAFYSHQRANLASAALARSLGLSCFLTAAAYT